MRGIVLAVETRISKAALKVALASALLLVMGSGAARAQLALDVSVTPNPVLPGELLRYEFTVTNAGDGVANSVTLSSEKSSSTSFVNADGPSNCTTGCTVVSWPLGNLSAGQSVTRRLFLRAGDTVPTGALLSNTIRATASNASEVHVDRSVPVDATRALVVAIAEETEPAVPGEALTYIVSFANNGTMADAGVMLRATVPQGTQFVSATQAGTEQDGVVSWDLGRMGVGQSGERRFTVLVTAAAESTVFSAAELHDAADPEAVRVRAEAATPVQAAPPLVLDVAVTPDPVQPDELLRYEFTVRNRSETTVTGAVLYDSPRWSDLSFVGADGPSNCTTGCTVVSWPLETLSAGQSVTRRLFLRAGASVPNGALLFNTAEVALNNGVPVHVDRSVPVDATRALVVAIAEETEPAVPGEALTYIVSFANNGTMADAGVMLRATVPQGTQFVSATQAGTEQDGVVSWDLGRIGVGQSGERRFTVLVTAAAESTVFSAAELHDAADPEAVRVRAEAATPVQAAPPLVLDVAVTPDPVQPDELLRYEFTVRNRSETTVTGAVLYDSPRWSDLSFVGADGPSNCTTGCTVVSWPLETLSAGQSVTRQLLLRAGASVPNGALLFNTAEVALNNGVPVHVDRSVPVDATRALAVAIAEETEPAVPGEALTYIVSFANNGTMADAGVMLRATVPQGTQFVSATQAGTEQDGVVSWGLGRVGVGQSGERRFTVQVTAAAQSTVFSAAELHDAADPGTVRVRAEAATPVQAAPPLVLDVAVTPDPVQPDELLRYEFTVRNRSETTVTGAVLYDSPRWSDLSFVGADGPSNCTTGCTVVSWPLETLSAGQSVTRQLLLRAGASVPNGALLFNTAEVALNNGVPVHVDRSVPVDATRALAVAIAEETEPAVPGEALTYIVSFANNGTMADPGVMLRATVPQGTQFVSATQAGTEQDGVVSWGLGRVGVGQSGERRFTVQVTAAAQSTVFSAAELHDAADPGTVRVRAEAATPVQAAPALVLDVTVTPDPVQPNEVFRYEFTVRNRSEITVTDVMLFDHELDGVSFERADAGASCNTGCTLVTFALGDLSAGQSVTKDLDLRVQPAVPGGAVLFNTAVVTAANAPWVRIDRNPRVCTLAVCEPSLTTPTPMATRTPTVPSTPMATPTRTKTPAVTPAITATQTPTPMAVPTNAVLVTGTCRRPGPQGLIACAAGTQITVSRCNNLSCDPANLTTVGSAQVDAAGAFELTLAFKDVTRARLLFNAVLNEGSTKARGVQQQTTYRVIDFGPAASGGHLTGAGIEPASEAALQLLSEGGLQNYTDSAIQEAADAVRTANAANSFAGEGAAAAVDTAVATARQNPAVQQALRATQPFCLGDCNADRTVTVDEIIVLVNIALGNSDLVACIPGNRSADIAITVDELLGTVNAALNGCPM